MTWSAELSHEAERQLRRLPRTMQQRMARAIDELENDPLQGDVKALRGGRQRRYRKRVGRYRIIFTLHHPDHIVEIAAIVIRDDRTYR